MTERRNRRDILSADQYTIVMVLRRAGFGVYRSSPGRVAINGKVFPHGRLTILSQAIDAVMADVLRRWTLGHA